MIAAGIVVVLCIMASMFVFIELLLRFDQILRARTERASAPEAVEPAGEADPEAAGAGDEVIAAIGLALQEHFAARVGFRSAATSGGAGPTPWASSGRLRIMSERQRVTTRRS